MLLTVNDLQTDSRRIVKRTQIYINVYNRVCVDVYVCNLVGVLGMLHFAYLKRRKNEKKKKPQSH